MRRAAVGALGAISLLGGALLYFFGPTRDPYVALAGSGVRIGLVLGAIWLAYPQLARIPWWFVQAGLVGALVIAVRPKYALVVLPLLLALWLVRPRKKKGKPRRPRSAPPVESRKR